jgi:signal transduction histidine kinase
LTAARADSIVETHLYRIAQEALNNVVKHSKATHVAVLLEKTADGVVLVVEDNGVGFDPEFAVSAERGHGLGLVGMRERANLIGGEIELESEAGRGTAIYVKVRPRTD